jgi:hypothetical protein
MGEATACSSCRDVHVGEGDELPTGDFSVAAGSFHFFEYKGDGPDIMPDNVALPSRFKP